jgi:hypothetical protein
MMRRKPPCSGALVALLVLAACDEKAPAAAPAKAEAEATAEDEALAKRKAQREAEAKAKADAAAALEAEIDALAVLPGDVPKTLDAACGRMTKAYDAYMQKVLTGDMLTKWKTGGNEMQISIFDRECKKGTPQIAACQAHALEQMPVTLEKELSAVMKRCAEKLGGA